MVLVSSVGSHLPIPGIVIYSASKSFVSYLGEGLHYELKEHGVDVIVYEPSNVETNMNRSSENTLSGGYITPEQAADVCFRDLAIDPTSFGHYKHAMFAATMNMFSNATMIPIFLP